MKRAIATFVLVLISVPDNRAITEASASAVAQACRPALVSFNSMGNNMIVNNDIDIAGTNSFVTFVPR